MATTYEVTYQSKETGKYVWHSKLIWAESKKDAIKKARARIPKYSKISSVNSK